LENKVDVFIPFHQKDDRILGHCVRSLSKFLRPKVNSITIISNDGTIDVDSLTKCLPNLHLIDESSVVNGLTKDHLGKIEQNGEDRTGWYFQQLLKYGASGLSSTDNYVVVDADTIFIKTTSLIIENKYLLRRSTQFHRPYFETYSKLFGYFPDKQPSFISNYMILSKQIISELLSKLEERFNQKWYDAILASLGDDPSSFSEFETYGYYLSKYHPSIYASVKRKNLEIPIDRFKLKNLEIPIDRFKLHRLNVTWALVLGYESITYHNYDRTER
jgi:hypothetical protein